MVSKQPDTAPGGDADDLREQVEHPAIRALFVEDPERLRSNVRQVLALAAEDPELESRLIDALDLANEECCDDSEAAVWVTVILGELRSRAAIPSLLRSFGNDADESLQDAAAIALLRIGEAALLALMEWLDEEPGPDLRTRSYELLGDSGMVDAPGYLETAREFLRARLSAERRVEGRAAPLEAAFEALVRLGDVEHIEALRELAHGPEGLRRPWLAESLELLESNESGEPFLPTMPPWVERYGWLFEEERSGGPISERLRAEREQDESSGVTVPLSAFEDEDSSEEEAERAWGDPSGLDDDTALSCLYWGLGSTAGREQENADLDARQFLSRPQERTDDEDDGDETPR